MRRCTSCSEPAPESGRFCPSCGSEIPADDTPTVNRTVETKPPSSSARRRTRFEAGEKLGSRYRIVAPLGSGGMGEVYRADDLELDQSVALKFLPATVANDAVELDRFRREARVAREIAHPNVCRMYDIAEVDGTTFLVMEHVTGEDLASVLRRMGKPSRDKAIEIARQLCLAVAAAHEKGVLHRDLKPANVMIDAHGHVRVMDFGLAGLAAELAGERGAAGTPAYMAPEQLEGKPVTRQSDVYALGLILYEVFTGRRLRESGDLRELRRQHSSGSVTAPSSVNADIDPAVERVILRCLETAPEDRPPSAYAVLGALPGGDPIAAALAAGEIPSPELVATSGGSAGVRPRFGVIAAALLTAALLVAAVTGHDRLAALSESPASLGFRARQILEATGQPEPLAHSAYGFWETTGQYVRPGAPGMFFWQRWAPEPMDPTDMHSPFTTLWDPPQWEDGSATLILDVTGRLLVFDAEPAPPGSTAVEVDPEALLSAAGADPSTLTRGPAGNLPLLAADSTLGWTDGDVTYSAALANGRVVHFSSERDGYAVRELLRLRAPDNRDQPWIVSLLVELLPLGVGIFLAYRHLRLGRADLRGAWFLAAVIFGGYFVESIFGVRAGEIGLLGVVRKVTGGVPVAHALLHSATIWFAYIAIEPYIRRWWPRVLVSWARLVSGKGRDPIVGRDVLAGAGAGGLSMLIHNAAQFAGENLGLVPVDTINRFELASLASPAASISITGYNLAITVLSTLIFLTQLFVLRWLLRSNRNATIAACLGFSVLNGFMITAETPEPEGIPLMLIQGLAGALPFIFVTLRFGLLAGLTAAFVRFMILALPWSLDASAWYLWHALPGVLVLLAILVYGYRTAIGGQALLRDALTEEGPKGGNPGR